MIMNTAGEQDQSAAPGPDPSPEAGGKSAETYDKMALECEAQAARAGSAAVREEYLRLAARWRSMAEQRRATSFAPKN